MKFIVIMNGVRMTVLYKDNDLRVCRQTFAVVRNPADGRYGVMMWEDEQTEENCYLVADSHTVEKAVEAMKDVLNRFVGFTRKKLHDELMRTQFSIAPVPGGGYSIGINPASVTHTAHTGHTHISATPPPQQNIPLNLWTG